VVALRFGLGVDESAQFIVELSRFVPKSSLRPSGVPYQGDTPVGGKSFFGRKLTREACKAFSLQTGERSGPFWGGFTNGPQELLQSFSPSQSEEGPGAGPDGFETEHPQRLSYCLWAAQQKMSRRRRTTTNKITRESFRR